MLSVLSTPCTKPAAIQLGAERARSARAPRAKKRGGARRGRVGRVPGQVVRDGSGRAGARSGSVSLEKREALEACRSGCGEWLSRTSTDERVGEGSSPRCSASPVSNRLKRLRGVDAERLEHLGREHLAHAALQRQPAVAAARPRRLAAALGAEIEQPAVGGVAQLREEEAAAVAEVGVVRAELMAVVAQRQRLREVVGQRLEAAEVALPLGVGEGVEPDARGPALVAEAEPVAGKSAGRTGSKNASPSAAWICSGRKRGTITGGISPDRHVSKSAEPLATLRVHIVQGRADCCSADQEESNRATSCTLHRFRRCAVARASRRAGLRPGV